MCALRKWVVAKYTVYNNMYRVVNFELILKSLCLMTKIGTSKKNQKNLDKTTQRCSQISTLLMSTWLYNYIWVFSNVAFEFFIRIGSWVNIVLLARLRDFLTFTSPSAKTVIQNVQFTTKLASYLCIILI